MHKCIVCGGITLAFPFLIGVLVISRWHGMHRMYLMCTVNEVDHSMPTSMIGLGIQGREKREGALDHDQIDCHGNETKKWGI